MTLYEISKKLENPKTIYFFKAGAMVHVFDLDAILMHRLLGYRIVLLGKEPNYYLRLGFPVNIVDKIAAKVAKELGLSVAFYSRQDLIKEYKANNKLCKKEYANQGDLDACIQDILAGQKEKNIITINKRNSKRNDDFLMHTKFLNLFTFISASIARYMPKTYRYGLGYSYLQEWTQSISLVNSLRNIPKTMQKQSQEFFDYKLVLLSKISSKIDLLKDISTAIYRVRGFKNKKSYKHIMLQLCELGRINLKLQTNLNNTVLPL